MERLNKAAIAAAGVVIAGVSPSAFATVKNNTTANLNTAGSWVSGTGTTPPGAGDVAVWDSTITGPLTVATGGALSWLGLQVTNPGGDITVTATAASNVLTLGASGIDMSASTANFSSGAVLALSGTQSWGINAGRTFAVTNTGTSAVRIGAVANGAATVNYTSAAAAATAPIFSTAGRFHIGFADNTTAALNISGTAKLVASDDFLMNQGVGSDAMLTIGDSASVSVTNAFVMGAVGNSSTDQSTSLVTQTGGTFTTGNFTLARGNGSPTVNNISSTFTISGGLQTNTAMFWGNTGAAGSVQLATVNLDGGTLRSSSFGSGGATATETFNFNGGQLEYANNVDDTPVFGGPNFSTMSVKNGGAKISVLNATRTMTVANPLLASPGSTGGLTKSGPGRLLLQGHNTFVGDTLVADGALEIDDTGSLLFDINASGDNTSIDGLAGGTESATFDGGFRLDLTDAAPLGSWNLVDANLASTYGAGFSVATIGGTAFTETADVWTLTQGGTTFTYTESSGTLVAVPEPSAVMAVALSGLAFGCRRRRRRHSSSSSSSSSSGYC